MSSWKQRTFGLVPPKTFLLWQLLVLSWPLRPRRFSSSWIDEKCVRELKNWRRPVTNSQKLAHSPWFYCTHQLHANDKFEHVSVSIALNPGCVLSLDSCFQGFWPSVSFFFFSTWSPPVLQPEMWLARGLTGNACPVLKQNWRTSPSLHAASSSLISVTWHQGVSQLLVSSNASAQADAFKNSSSIFFLNLPHHSFWN